ncbi:MAG: hypothetical protein ACREP9_13375 [Candidatus Dormibacteraceae bacterium]
MSESTTKQIIAEIYEGVSNPRVELKNQTSPIAPAGSKEEPAGERVEEIDEPLAISLEHLVSEMHNQSYGMISASTGCISNPGGPSC